MSETVAVPGNAGRDDYPKMLYHPDGRTAEVEGPAQDEAMRREGWSPSPSPIHHRPPPTPSAAVGGGDPLGMMIRAILEQVLDERGVGKAPGAPDPVPEMPPRNRRGG